MEEKTSELRRELETAMQQVEELRAARQRQEVMVESIIVERDMYKSIADNAEKDADNAPGASASAGPKTPSATSTPGAPPPKSTPSPRDHLHMTSTTFLGPFPLFQFASIRSFNLPY